MKNPELSANTNRASQTLLSPDWEDYELLDSGNGEKLERFASHILIRPEAGADWKPGLSRTDWMRRADAVYHPGSGSQPGRWEFNRQIPLQWGMGYKQLRFQIQLSASRHVGVFPEQAGYWDWIFRQVQSADRQMKVLNLFGYTGLATLAAASAGAEVVHVDASSRAVRWARLNQQLSGLQEHAVRWLVDDALQFVEKEIRRGRQYDGLILDPPKYGHGPDHKVWDFMRYFPLLLEKCRLLLGSQPRFVALTVYAVNVSSLTLHSTLQDLMSGWDGRTSSGHIVLQEINRQQLLNTASFVRWEESR